jgi:endo-1,4-beta-xylanase
VPQSFENAAAQNLIGPVIIVFPDGYSDSFWADSIGGDKPAETDVVRQLVPHVDATFRTIADVRSRVMQGF